MLDRHALQSMTAQAQMWEFRDTKTDLDIVKLGPVDVDVCVRSWGALLDLVCAILCHQSASNWSRHIDTNGRVTGGKLPEKAEAAVADYSEVVRLMEEDPNSSEGHLAANCWLHWSRAECYPNQRKWVNSHQWEIHRNSTVVDGRCSPRKESVGGLNVLAPPPVCGFPAALQHHQPRNVWLSQRLCPKGLGWGRNRLWKTW